MRTRSPGFVSMTRNVSRPGVFTQGVHLPPFTDTRVKNPKDSYSLGTWVQLAVTLFTPDATMVTLVTASGFGGAYLGTTIFF